MARAWPTTTFTSTSSSSCSLTTDPSSPCGWTVRAARVPTARCRSMTGSASTTRSARWHPRRLSPCAARTCAGVATRRAPFEPTNGRSFPLLCARPNAPQKSRRRPTTANSPDRWPPATRTWGRARHWRTTPVPWRGTPRRSTPRRAQAGSTTTSKTPRCAASMSCSRSGRVRSAATRPSS